MCVHICACILPNGQQGATTDLIVHSKWLLTWFIALIKPFPKDFMSNLPCDWVTSLLSRSTTSKDATSGKCSDHFYRRFRLSYGPAKQQLNFQPESLSDFLAHAIQVQYLNVWRLEDVQDGVQHVKVWWGALNSKQLDHIVRNWATAGETDKRS